MKDTSVLRCRLEEQLSSCKTFSALTVITGRYVEWDSHLPVFKKKYL